MKKRIGSLLLVVAMCLTLLPTAAFAVDDEETAAAPEKFVITSVSDLQTFADAVNEGDYDGKTDAVVTLDADLDLAGIAWTPMGDTSHDFAGTFDGQGHTILEMSRNVQSGNTQNLKSTVIQRSFPKWSVAERRKTAAASDQAAVCACAHSRYFAGGSPSGLRV